jgi:hypothetical protein
MKPNRSRPPPWFAAVVVVGAIAAGMALTALIALAMQ